MGNPHVRSSECLAAPFSFFRVESFPRGTDSRDAKDDNAGPGGAADPGCTGGCPKMAPGNDRAARSGMSQMARVVGRVELLNNSDDDCDCSTQKTPKRLVGRGE